MIANQYITNSFKCDFSTPLLEVPFYAAKGC